MISTMKYGQANPSNMKCERFRHFAETKLDRIFYELFTPTMLLLPPALKGGEVDELDGKSCENSRK